MATGQFVKSLHLIVSNYDGSLVENYLNQGFLKKTLEGELFILKNRSAHHSLFRHVKSGGAQALSDIFVPGGSPILTGPNDPPPRIILTKPRPMIWGFNF